MNTNSDTPTQVLFINHSIRDGGPGKSLFYILKYLDRTKVEPHVLIPKDDVFSERLKHEGIYENIILDKRFPENLKRPRLASADDMQSFSGINKLVSILLNILDLISLIITSPFLIRNNKIDIVYCNGTQAKIVGAFIGLINFRPVIWHVRNIQQTWLLDTVMNLLAASPSVKKIIAVSGPTAHQFRNGKEKVVVVHNGIDPEAYDPKTTEGNLRSTYKIPKTAVVVGSTGRIVPRKGYDKFIEAARYVSENIGNKAEKVKFVIVGDTPYFFDDHLSNLKKKVHDYGLGDSFIFTGYRSDVRQSLTDFDIFVIPSDYPDPFPRVVIEAMSYALPVIGFKMGGIVESVDNGVTGTLCESGDTDAVGKAILELIENPTLRRKMGRAGRKRACELFVAKDRTKDIQDYILEVARGS